MQYNTESDEAKEGTERALASSGSMRQPVRCRRMQKSRGEFPFPFTVKISKNSIIINSGQGEVGGERRERQMNGAGLGSARATMTTDTSKR